MKTRQKNAPCRKCTHHNDCKAWKRYINTPRNQPFPNEKPWDSCGSFCKSNDDNYETEGERQALNKAYF